MFVYVCICGLEVNAICMLVPAEVRRESTEAEVIDSELSNMGALQSYARAASVLMIEPFLQPL